MPIRNRRKRAQKAQQSVPEVPEVDANEPENGVQSDIKASDYDAHGLGKGAPPPEPPSPRPSHHGESFIFNLPDEEGPQDNKDFVSSLPPSSIPLPSPGFEFNPIANDEPEHEEIKEDPFGFFAAERRLKTYKEHSAPRAAKVEDWRERLRREMETANDDVEEGSQNTDNDPLRTPHKQRVEKRKPLSSPSSTLDSLHIPSMPSSPSPSKAARLHPDSPPPAPVLTERRNRANRIEQTDPAKLAKELGKLLPKRPAKKTAVAVEQPKGRGRSRKKQALEVKEEPKKKAAAKPRGARKLKTETAIEMVVEDEVRAVQSFQSGVQLIMMRISVGCCCCAQGKD